MMYIEVGRLNNYQIKQFDKVLGNVVNNIINTFSQYNPANLSCPAFNCPNGSKQIYCVFRYKN